MTKKLSTEEMNKIILERVPLEDRLQAVYLPIVVMDCACYLIEDLLTTMGAAKLSATKPMSRRLRSCVEGYRADNKKVMHSTLYENLTTHTKKFYKSLSQNTLIHQIQYQQAMLSRHLEFSVEVSKMIALTHIIRKLVTFVIELDKEFTEKVSSLLGPKVHYSTADNAICVDVNKTLSQMLTVLGVEQFYLETSQTDMAFQVFKNKLHSLKIW